MIQYKGGDGSAKEKAVIILGAKIEFERVYAEYDYLDKKFGGYEFLDQTFIGEDQKQYDILKIQLLDGSSKEVWFDISEFYGK